MKKAKYLTLLTLFLSASCGICLTRHFELRASGEGPETDFGVAISFPYENSGGLFGRILQNQGYDVGASWFIVSHWNTPLSWAEVQREVNPAGDPVFSDVDTVTLDALRGCHDRGIKTMVTLSFSNPAYYPEWLYTPDRPSTCDGGERWCFYVRSADDPDGKTSYDDEDPDIGHIETTYICAEWLARYLKYCKTIAEYYGEYVDGWMVWEEQNWVPSGGPAADSCECKSEFWRPYPPGATEDDWRKMTRLYAEMLLNAAPLMKRLTPHAKLVFGATCGCDVPYIEAVVEEMAALGATPEFFSTNINGYGFHGFRSGVWRSEAEQHLGSPEVEVPSPHQYAPTDQQYGTCSMFTHYASLGAPTRSFLEQVSDLRTRVGAITGQDPDSIELYDTEDGSPFQYSSTCDEQQRGFVRMAKYLARSDLICQFANIHVTHWQMQEGNAGDIGADYGLINRTDTNSGCRLTPDTPYMLPELSRQAFYTFQLVASIYDKTLSYVDPSSLGVTLFNTAPNKMTLPISYQPRPERSAVATGNQDIALMVHVPTADPSRQGEVLISDWKMTDFPLAIGDDYHSEPGLTHVMTDESLNPNTIPAWLKIDLSAPELVYDTTVPPEVFQVSTLPEGDLHTLDVSCKERPLLFSIDSENANTIIIENATISDFVNILQIAPAEYPSFRAAGTLDSYLSVNPDGSVAGNLAVVGLPYGPSFIDSIKVFYYDLDLSTSMNDRGQGSDATAGDGVFTALLTAPGTAPGAPNSLIAAGAKHPIIFAAGISQNAMFANEGGSFVVRAFAFDADNPWDSKSIASCEVRIPGTTLTFPMEQQPTAPGDISAFEWSTTVEFEDLSGVAAGLYLVEVVATDHDGLESVPWPHIPTGDGTYIQGLYLNLRVKGRSGNFERCWPELRLK